jgi:hypothetical protein
MNEICWHWCASDSVPRGYGGQMPYKRNAIAASPEDLATHGPSSGLHPATFLSIGAGWTWQRPRRRLDRAQRHSEGIASPPLPPQASKQWDEARLARFRHTREQVFIQQGQCLYAYTRLIHTLHYISQQEHCGLFGKLFVGRYQRHMGAYLQFSTAPNSHVQGLPAGLPPTTGFLGGPLGL